MYWVSLEPIDADKELLKSLRDARYTSVNTEKYAVESTPHLTIVPGFSVPDDCTPTVDEISLNTPITIEFDAYHIWPSLENPMVVAIDPKQTSELEMLRENTLDYIQALDGSVEYDPTPFHLTLFKGGNAGDESEFEVDEESHSAIESFVNSDDSLPITLTFDTVKLTEWKT